MKFKLEQIRIQLELKLARLELQRTYLRPFQQVHAHGHGKHSTDPDRIGQRGWGCSCEHEPAIDYGRRAALQQPGRLRVDGGVDDVSQCDAATTGGIHTLPQEDLHVSCVPCHGRRRGGSMRWCAAGV